MHQSQPPIYPQSCQGQQDNTAQQVWMLVAIHCHLQELQIKLPEPYHWNSKNKDLVGCKKMVQMISCKTFAGTRLLQQYLTLIQRHFALVSDAQASIIAALVSYHVKHIFCK
jgi:hypothetical protein